MKEHIEDILVGGRPMTKLERANKEIEKLNKALDIATEIINNKQKEIVRLNNIINKIEEILKEHIDECRAELNMIMKTEDLDYVNECSTQFAVIRKNIEMIMEKIEKLKGVDRE